MAMFSLLAVFLLQSAFYQLCKSQVVANCSPEDHSLTFGESSLGYGMFTSRCSRDETYRDINLGRFHFNRSPIADEYMNVFANITVSCFDAEGNEVLSEFNNKLNERLHSWYNEDLYQLVLNRGLKCNFAGCYDTKQPNEKAYLMDVRSCYIDFNECSSEDFHDCDGTADCINDEMGTYSCEYLDGYIGSGDHSEEGSGSRDEQGSAVVVPVLEDVSEDVAVKNGLNTTLHCSGSSAVGDVNITWSTSIPGIVLPQPTVVTDGNTTTSYITLESVDDSYSGNYYCNISNRFGEIVGNTFLSVISIPELEIVSITTGSTVNLTCKASGSSDLEFTWLFPSVHAHGNVLTLTNVGKADEMEYICDVSLKNTTIGECRITLQTQGPEITASPSNVTMKAPTNFTLNCTAVNNNDAPNSLAIHWTKNDNMLLENTSTTAIHNNTMTSQLFVSYDAATQKNDIYQCIATNRELEDGTKSLPAFITISEKVIRDAVTNSSDLIAPTQASEFITISSGVIKDAVTFTKNLFDFSPTQASDSSSYIFPVTTGLAATGVLAIVAVIFIVTITRAICHRVKRNKKRMVNPVCDGFEKKDKNLNQCTIGSILPEQELANNEGPRDTCATTDIKPGSVESSSHEDIFDGKSSNAFGSGQDLYLENLDNKSLSIAIGNLECSPSVPDEDMVSHTSIRLDSASDAHLDSASASGLAATTATARPLFPDGDHLNLDNS